MEDRLEGTLVLGEGLRHQGEGTLVLGEGLRQQGEGTLVLGEGLRQQEEGRQLRHLVLVLSFLVEVVESLLLGSSQQPAMVGAHVLNNNSYCMDIDTTTETSCSPIVHYKQPSLIDVTIWTMIMRYFHT